MPNRSFSCFGVLKLPLVYANSFLYGFLQYSPSFDLLWNRNLFLSAFGKKMWFLVGLTIHRQEPDQHVAIVSIVHGVVSYMIILLSTYHYTFKMMVDIYSVLCMFAQCSIINVQFLSFLCFFFSCFNFNKDITLFIVFMVSFWCLIKWPAVFHHPHLSSLVFL